ncbi:MAG TPA: Ig-like domain-containing protein [Steroidobacteraceae bacterium]|nr:Ig-like domain-containing protein [Steroidobacteraceae bacterium]
MLPVSLRNLLVPLCFATALSACGGGGGDDDPPPPPANRAPVLTTTALAATEDTALAAQIAATDADGNTLTFTRVNNVQHGTLTISAAGAVAYTPAANYAGTDTFSVRVNDGAGGEVTGTVTITVAAVNDAPAFTTVAFSVAEDSSLSGQLTPTDIDSTTLTVTRTSDPQHGQATITAAGGITYVPSVNYFGADSFNVRVADGAGGETPATVTITVNAVNDAPVLVTGALAVNEDNVLSVQLVGADVEGQPLTFSLDSGTSHGPVSLSSSGLLTYTPSSNYFGSDTLSVRVSDSPQAGASWPITITVNSVNDSPVAADDEIRIATGVPRTMVVTGNDSDVEGGSLTVSIAQQPTGGTVSVGANNLLTFTPANDFTGPITFTYRLTDGDGGQDDATVRALIGDFQGIVYLADDLTPGRQEIFLFDGLNSRRLVQAPANNFQFITRFTVSGDGSKLLYVVAGPLVDEFYFKAINAAGPGTKIWANAPSGGPNVNVGTPRLAINHNGSNALIEDRYSSAAKRIYVVDTSTLAAMLLGRDAPHVVRASIVLFNPFNQGQLVLQGQVGGTEPVDGSEYYTAFLTSVNSSQNLTQIGSNYPQLQGSGSGFGFWFGGPNGGGRFVYHTEYLPTATPAQKSLLVHDTNAGELLVHRRPTGAEYGITNLPAANGDGSRIVYGFTEPNPTSGDGPAAFYVTNPETPTIATPLSTPYPLVGRIQFTSNNDTVILQAVGASGRQEIFAASSLNPVGQPVRVGKALDTGEELSRVYVVRNAQRLIVGYRTPPSNDTRLYNLSVSSTGTETPFATAFPNSGPAGEGLDDLGQFIAYTPVEGSRRILRIMSTRAVDYSMPVMGSASTSGVSQFQWLPRP